MIPHFFQNLAGQWQGTNQLLLPDAEQIVKHESDSVAELGLVVNQNFLELAYSWSFERQPQNGKLILGINKNFEVSAVWFDSWHQSASIMNLSGHATEQHISVKGFYAVPGHPAWGWRINLELRDDSRLGLTMFNIEPEGAEDLAVEALYQKSS